MSLPTTFFIGRGGLALPDPAEVLFTTLGGHSWTVPDGVTSVCVVCIGGGGGGFRNGQSSSGISSGGNSYFINTSTVAGFGGIRGSETWSGSADQLDQSGNNWGHGGSYVGDGGGNGGNSRIPASSPTSGFYSGGGAAGYTGNGGDAGKSNGFGQGVIASQAGQGGGGSGGSWYGGGGVGIYGQGASGAGDNAGSPAYQYRGQGGSGGTDAGYQNPFYTSQSSSYYDYNAGFYGGGGAGTYSVGGGGGGLGWKNNIAVTPGSSITVQVGAPGTPNRPDDNSGYGGHGAVRVLWGKDRAFPSTSVDLASSTAGQTVV